MTIFSSSKPVTEDEKILLSIIEAMINKKNTFMTVMNEIGYISNEECGYDIIIYDTYITLSNVDDFKSSKVRSNFSDGIIKMIANHVENRTKKIKEISKNNEISFLNGILLKVK